MGLHEDSRILIIDGLNTFLRVWASMPEISENGEHIGGILGFMRSVGVNIRDFNPTKCVIVFDGKGGSQRRKKLYPEYKGNRKGTSSIKRDFFISEHHEVESMKYQMNRIFEYLSNLPVKMICVENIEADDVIAYITSNYYKHRECDRIRIVSTDRDFLQLIGDRVEVYSPVKKKLFTAETFTAEYGMLPENYLVFRTLDGDMGDNIPGVPGIGIKTMLKTFPELNEGIFTKDDLLNASTSALSNKKPKKIHETIVGHRAVIERNYDLMQLHDVDISGTAKMYISDVMAAPVSNLRRYDLKKLLIGDYLTTHFKNFDNWINLTFNGLSVWSKIP